MLTLLLACRVAAPTPEPGAAAHDSGLAVDTGAVDTGTSPSDSGIDTASGDSAPTDSDTAPSDSDTAPLDSGECPQEGQIAVRLSQYERAKGCWETVNRVENAAYWWEYAEGCGDDCSDIAWRLADGETCFRFPCVYPTAKPYNDPAITATAEQAAWCSSLPDTPDCP